MTLEHWRKVVKLTKNKIVSSLFSKRTHVVCKLTFNNEELMEALILFYNLVLQKE